MDHGRSREPDLSNCVLTPRGTHNCSDGRIFFVRNVYPPIQELQPRVMLVITIYFCCFIVGICGNVSILTIIRSVLNERRVPRCHAFRRTDNAILYIAALCVVDLLMSLSLPHTVMNSIIGFWMFGTGVCKLHHICGSVGRILSTFLITAMSFDRFVAVCYPYNNKFRSQKFVIYIIFALWILAFLLLLPMLVYAGAQEMLVHHIINRDVTNPEVENLTRVRVYKCTDMMPQVIFYWFTLSTFALGYVVPLVLIIYFNSRLIGKLYRHTKQLRTTIPLRRISIYTILIAVFYFVCWTPYWCSVLYAIYMSLFEDEQSGQTSDMLLFIIFCVHLLPYIGSASNWILYGLLNTQVRQNDQTGGGGGTLTQCDDCTDRYTLNNAMSTTAISPYQALENGSATRNVDGRFYSMCSMGALMNRRETLPNNNLLGVRETMHLNQTFLGNNNNNNSYKSQSYGMQNGGLKNRADKLSTSAGSMSSQQLSDLGEDYEDDHL